MRRYRRSMRRRRRLDAETSALGAATSAIARSYRRYRRGVSGDIGDCRVGLTPQMCNRVTNHGDMSTFSKPGPRGDFIPPTPPTGNPMLIMYLSRLRGYVISMAASLHRVSSAGEVPLRKLSSQTS